MDSLLCSACFHDHGLQLEALRLGVEDATPCPTCGASDGRKLDAPLVEQLAHTFFVRGTVCKPDFGAYPELQFNNSRYPGDDLELSASLQHDVPMISDAIKIGVFRYGPRSWMFGEIEPLKALQEPGTRDAVMRRILTEYPNRTLGRDESFYRLRIGVQDPRSPAEYDTPPDAVHVDGRLNAPDLPILYGSQDLEVCIHECRATVDDLIFVATLTATRDLRLLDLTALLTEDVTEFESLDLAVQMLFLAARHSYEICRAVAVAARAEGFDGIIYPSYFGHARAGGIPFEAPFYGISVRRVPQFAEYARSKVIPNLALFGRPLAEGSVSRRCINRLILHRVAYDVRFGPGHF